MIMVMMLNVLGVLLLVSIAWYWCWIVAAAYVDMPVGRGRPGTAVGSVTATLPPTTGRGGATSTDTTMDGGAAPLPSPTRPNGALSALYKCSIAYGGYGCKWRQRTNPRVGPQWVARSGHLHHRGERLPSPLAMLRHRNFGKRP